ncbi:hypothetical protein Mlute_00284 [Meiothermus luteus]|jgi:hypothetical protein|uniref:GNAT family N-acetyltransferase n=1 Tax=Meiothermus luteus TaxID=2026184 RepID=A0A399EZN0_9DEIN|nr:hypothetical protein [Meiothermus luteus]RIH89488.1 hypothetical protein Mlute_00284 [Meiothermus luteus]RMH54316.1 MAG: hypothetical protein D6684_10030 [Deinococcota bacterium]
MLDLCALYRPLASREHSGQAGGLPYLLQPQFPLLLTNTAFGHKAAAQREIEARFLALGAPPAFTLWEEADASALLAAGYRPGGTFELCVAEAHPTPHRVVRVPWSEAWKVARILTEAYGASAWRLAFAQAVGRWLQNPSHTALIAYAQGHALGAALVAEPAGLMLGVLPDGLGQEAGRALLSRIHPRPFIRAAGTELELPGRVVGRLVRYELPVE